MVNLQAGVRYAPPNLPGFAVMLTFEWEQWFGSGPPGGRHSEIGVQGVLLRGEFTF